MMLSRMMSVDELPRRGKTWSRLGPVKQLSSNACTQPRIIIVPKHNRARLCASLPGILSVSPDDRHVTSTSFAVSSLQLASACTTSTPITLCFPLPCQSFRPCEASQRGAAHSSLMARVLRPDAMVQASDPSFSELDYGETRRKRRSGILDPLSDPQGRSSTTLHGQAQLEEEVCMVPLLKTPKADLDVQATRP